MATLKSIYPWTKIPFLVSAPMLGAATPRLAANVTFAGGMGFLAGGTNPEALAAMLDETSALLTKSPSSSSQVSAGRLPIGVGFQLFNTPLDPLAEVIARYKPAAVWLFAPKEEIELQAWSERIRAVTDSKTAIWIQVGSVSEAKRSLSLANPDMFVLQGSDAGGHGRMQSASIISLVPEVLDMLKYAGRPDIPILAAGGIVDSRGFAAALSLGASGVVMGTRFLVAEESGIANGWKREIIRAQDGGVSTVRSTLGDRLKQTKGWPSHYDGRAIKNKGHEDEEAGVSESRNIELYQAELKEGDDAWHPDARMVAWAGTGVGLIERMEPAGQIVDEVLRGTTNILSHTAKMMADGSDHSHAQDTLPVGKSSR